MKKIFVLTGEPSGDKLASKVIFKLKRYIIIYLHSVVLYTWEKCKAACLQVKVITATQTIL